MPFISMKYQALNTSLPKKQTNYPAKNKTRQECPLKVDQMAFCRVLLWNNREAMENQRKLEGCDAVMSLFSPKDQVADEVKKSNR